MTGYKIRTMRREEIPTVVEMVRASFGSQLRPYMIFGQVGISSYLSIPFEYPNVAHTQESLVAVMDSDVVAYAEFRFIDSSTAFLSYICVAPHAQGRGIASQLIERFLAMKPSITELNLDVFPSNTRARKLYEKLGFRRVATSAWVRRPLPAPTSAVSIPSLPAAMAAYDRYGFCEFDVVVGRDLTRVGLLGSNTVRCTTARTFEDDVLLGGLREVFSQLTGAFAVLPHAQSSSLKSAHEVLTLSDRMTLAV